MMRVSNGTKVTHPFRDVCLGVLSLLVWGVAKVAERSLSGSYSQLVPKERFCGCKDSNRSVSFLQSPVFEAPEALYDANLVDVALAIRIGAEAITNSSPNATIVDAGKQLQVSAREAVNTVRELGAEWEEAATYPLDQRLTRRKICQRDTCKAIADLEIDWEALLSLQAPEEQARHLERMDEFKKLRLSCLK